MGFERYVTQRDGGSLVAKVLAIEPQKPNTFRLPHDMDEGARCMRPAPIGISPGLILTSVTKII